jgi:hypothetical protein
MKYIFALICLAMTNSAMAHEDHALGESVHVAYHIAFWSLCALVAYKGIIWFKTKKILNKDR